MVWISVKVWLQLQLAAFWLQFFARSSHPYCIQASFTLFLLISMLVLFDVGARCYNLKMNAYMMYEHVGM